MKPHTRFYSFAYHVFGPVVRLWHPTVVEGLENLPESRVLLCSNHSDNWDPVLLALALPVNYRLHIMAKEELFRNPMHPYTKSLLSAIPLPDPIYEKNRQRIVYNPLASHDYTEDKPSFREIAPGHFVHCNDAEEARYKEELV